MKIKQRPEDFVVREAYRVDWDPKGPWRVYLMDKQKLSTFEAVERICAHFRIPPKRVSFCGLKDKQGRTEQLVAIHGLEEQLQEPDLRLKYLGRTRERSEEHTSELQSRENLVCRLLLEKKKIINIKYFKTYIKSKITLNDYNKHEIHD